MSGVPFPGEYFKLINLNVIARLDAALRPLGLTTAQSDLLCFLDQRGGAETTVQDIGTHFHLKHPTVVGIVHRLEDKGFVSTAVSPRDRRCRIVRLTLRFDEVRRVMSNHRALLDERSTRGFTDGELLRLRDMLERVYQNVRMD
ncbi:MAG: MarR family transcriptional regulator [Eubacteriales bacterium]|nr:MarR family transcriptional regulator [Eubacteriales bacterium]